MLVRAGWLDGGFAAGALARFVTPASHQQVEIGPWGHGGSSFADTLRPSGAADHDPLSPGSQDRRLVEFFARYLERNGTPEGPSTLTFGTLGHGHMAGRHLVAARGYGNAAVVSRFDGRPGAGGGHGRDRDPPRRREHLPDFDRRYAALQAPLATLDTWRDTVIHGDLLGGNILVDEQNQPLAVLDFGFLTTAGDPRLDAAITASVMNMYGPNAPSTTQDSRTDTASSTTA